MWYDNYKTEKILINSDGNHNKFWTIKLDEANCAVVIRWGRIGTTGQTQVKTFDTITGACSFISSKLSNKVIKGYTDTINGVKITKAMLDRLDIEAVIVGTQNKLDKFAWVEIVESSNTHLYYKLLKDENRLYDPDCEPGILIEMQTRKEIDGRNNFVILLAAGKPFDVTWLTTDLVYEWVGGHSCPPELPQKREPHIHSVHIDTCITESHPLYNMVNKIEEMVSSRLFN